MSNEKISTGCLGVNEAKDLQPIKTPEGDEYVVKLGVFNTPNVEGRFTHAIAQDVIDDFSRRRHWVCVHGMQPTHTQEERLKAAIEPNMRYICARLTDVKSLPFGDKQLIIGRIAPCGPYLPVLEEMLKDPSGQLKFGMRAVVDPKVVDGRIEQRVVTLHGFNLVA